MIFASPSLVGVPEFAEMRFEKNKSSEVQVKVAAIIFGRKLCILIFQFYLLPFIYQLRLILSKKKINDANLIILPGYLISLLRKK